MLTTAGNHAFADRPLAARVRPELVVQPIELAERRCWRVKDPVSHQYFELSDEEYAILRMLDGRTSLAEIRRRFERLFAPLQLTIGQLQAYLANLHHEGLILADVPGQGAQLLKRARTAGRGEVVSTLLNCLAIRFRGVDPDRFLNFAYARLHWLFSPVCMVAALSLVVGALLLAGLQFDKLQSRLSALDTFFVPANLIWLGVALAFAKLLHELGHALACKHFGGECHEMGVLLLAFTPCLYCDVSDAWLMPDKWRRIATSAAGVIVEVCLAATGTFLWWLSEPGLFNSLCLNLLFVCSVSTLLFNGNPLLRYDGYYILSDLLDEPNLADRSSALLAGFLRQHCLGIETPGDPRVSNRRAVVLGVYGLLSAVYRWFVLGVILWFAYGLLNEAGLAPLAHLLISATLAGVLLQPAMVAVQFLKSPPLRQQIQLRNALGTLAVCGAGLAALCLMPVPQRVAAQAIMQDRDGRHVYISASGKLVRSVPAGTAVKTGDLLGELANLELDREVEKLLGEKERLSIHVHNLEARRADDAEAAAEIPAAREMLTDIEQRLQQRQRDATRLRLVAPADGIVLPPPAALAASPIRGELGRWQGTPLEHHNLGCWLETGMLFCIIGDPQFLEPILILNQTDVDLVQPGQRVRIVLEQIPGTILTGTIREIAVTNLQVVPRELTGQIATRMSTTDRPELPRPAETMYQARVALDDSAAQPLLRTRGTAKVAVDPLPLGAWFLRVLQQTFHFHM